MSSRSRGCCPTCAGSSQAELADDVATTLLPHLRGVIPALAALHLVNALVIFWIALTLARQAKAFAWLRMQRKPRLPRTA